MRVYASSAIGGLEYGCCVYLFVIFGFVFLWADRVSIIDHQLVMALRRAKRGKSKIASKPEVVFDQLRFEMHAGEETFESLIKYRSI